MKRLGYTRYVATGGDWGALITDLMGVQAPPGLLGMHTNIPASFRPRSTSCSWPARRLPAGLSADEKHAYDSWRPSKELNYAFFMATRPQTLTASRIHRSAWPPMLLDHDPRSLELIARSFDGVPEGLTRDDVLDNITPVLADEYRRFSRPPLLGEHVRKLTFAQGRQDPGGRERVPGRTHQAPRSWAEQAYPKLVHYNRLAKGGHFAAWEQPKVLRKKCARGSDRCADSGEAHVSASSRMADHVVNGVTVSARGRHASRAAPSTQHAERGRHEEERQSWQSVVLIAAALSCCR